MSCRLVDFEPVIDPELIIDAEPIIGAIIDEDAGLVDDPVEAVSLDEEFAVEDETITFDLSSRRRCSTRSPSAHRADVVR